MNLKHFLIGLLLGCSSLALAQKEVWVLQNRDSIKAVFPSKEGILNGEYLSYYKNGQQRAKGQFKNNFRTGEWSVWDQSGQLRAKRLYTAPFIYTTLYPEPPTSPLVQLLNVPQHQAQRDAQGVMGYHFIHQRVVFWEGRFRRFLPNEGMNASWMPALYALLQQHHQQGLIHAYQEAKFEHTVAATPAPAHQQLLGFQMKEVTFFDTERFVLETRILGLCPVLLDTLQQDTSTGSWYYYPELRPLLAQQSLTPALASKGYQHLDDLFHFRYFGSYIYYHQHYNNKQPALLPAVLDAVQLAPVSDKEEMQYLELEHAFWETFSRRE